MALSGKWVEQDGALVLVWTEENTEEIHVGPVDSPVGTVYVYRIGRKVSEHTYANAPSAWHDASRPQHVNEAGHLEPVAA